MTTLKKTFLICSLLFSNLLLAQEYVENKKLDNRGDIYTGYMKNGKFHGKGIYNSTLKGWKKEGEWKNGVLHGKGIIVLASGDKISGEWKEGKKHGKSIYHFTLLNSALHRTYVDGVNSGNYYFVYGNGTILEGKTIDDLKEGQFNLKFKDGKQQVLIFKNNKLINSKGFIHEGFAYYKIYNGGSYSGEWKNNQPHGMGSIILSDWYYEGEWKNGIRHGTGYMRLSNGDTYQGQFKNSKYHGKGIDRVKKTKAFYVGEFKNGQRHGKGKLTMGWGYSYKGTFVDGKRHGKIIMTEWNDKQQIQTYDNGKMISHKSLDPLAKVEEKSAENSKTITTTQVNKKKSTSTKVVVNTKPKKVKTKSNLEKLKKSESNSAIYVKAFEKIFSNLANHFEFIVPSDEPYKSTLNYNFYVPCPLIIPNIDSNLSVLFIDKRNKKNYIRVKMNSNIKTEISSVFRNKKSIGRYQICKVPAKKMRIYKECFIIEKDQKVIGTLNFQHDTNDNNWFLNIFAFNQAEFERSLVKIAKQGMKDNYESWKGLLTDLGEGMYESKQSLYHASGSLIYQIKEGINNVMHPFFEMFPIYVFEHIMAKWKVGNSIDEEFKIQENFIKHNTTSRVIKLRLNQTEFLMLFEPSAKSMYGFTLSHGGNYDKIQKGVFKPDDIDEITKTLIESAKKRGCELVWSSGKIGNKFKMNFDAIFEDKSKIAGEYEMDMVFQPGYGTPSYGVSGYVNGKFVDIRSESSKIMDLGVTHKVSYLKFLLEENQTNLYLNGSYGSVSGPEVVWRVLLYKKKN